MIRVWVGKFQWAKIQHECWILLNKWGNSLAFYWLYLPVSIGAQPCFQRKSSSPQPLLRHWIVLHAASVMLWLLRNLVNRNIENPTYYFVCCHLRDSWWNHNIKMFSATTVKEAINSKFKIWPADYMLLHDFFRLIVTLASVWSTGRTGFPNNLFGVYCLENVRISWKPLYFRYSTVTKNVGQFSQVHRIIWVGTGLVRS